MVQAQGYAPEVLGGDYCSFCEDDALLLANAVGKTDIKGVIVDSYAATDGFLATLRKCCHGNGEKIGYIDDEYRFESGFSPEPVRLPVDVLVNYGLGASSELYWRAYEGSDVELLIGPAFAPVREEFSSTCYGVSDPVSTILVTTGSTNPDGALERLVSCCAEAIPEASIHIVVGANARFEDEESFESRFVFHHNSRDMRSLMLASDLVISAGGTTLYELAALGVPTIAVPITENQLANVSGWRKHCLGFALQSVEWSDGELIGMIHSLATGIALRQALSSGMREVCDGQGARRVAEAILG